MRKKTIFLFVVGTMGLLGCPHLSHYCDEGYCDPKDDGGTDVSAPDGTSDTSTDATTDRDPPPPGCDTPTEPLKNPEKCLVDSFGVFVSPSGDDGNAGTKEKPLKTIGKALQSGRDRVVVCEGEYAGSLDVTRAVEIYGGVSCDFKKAGAKPKVAASKPGYGIKVEKVAALVILADLDVVGMNAAAPSESSVGVFVSESADVKVLRSRIEAGDGADAPAARDGSFTLAAKAADGQMAVGNTGGPPGDTGACPGGGSSKGGTGGNLGFQGQDATPMPPGGAKGDANGNCAFGLGKDGDPGTTGQARAGAATVASLGVTGLTGSKGQDGAHGTIGGGGGGGYGAAGAGGGGAAGGCGGQGGFGGAAGGSSVALVSFASTVSLQATELIAKIAKPGGAGGKGQIGQAGGFGGNRSGGACNGGNGAKGGDGGGGGGGAGGIAAGIAWSGGKEPAKDATTKITRPTGPAPTGGEGGAGATNKGVDGVHADVFEVK